MSNTVIVSENARGVHLIDQTSLQSHEIGTLVSRIYEGESVQRHFFIEGVNPSEYFGEESIPGGVKTYRLGPTTTDWEFVDHPDVLNPLLQMGFTISKLFYGRGGLTMSAILNPPDFKIQEDNVSWDYEFWQEYRKNTPLVDYGIIESVVVTSSIKPKKAINYLRGWFRLICTNGLMGSVFSWPKLRMNHNYFDPSRVEEYLNDYAVGGQFEFSRGPFIGTGRGIGRLQSWLQDYVATHSANLEDLEDSDDEDDSASVSTTYSGNLLPDIEEEEVPFSVRQSLEPINRMPNWYALSLAEQFELMANGLGSGKVYAADMLNAITNPFYARNLVEPEFSPIRLMSKTESLFKSFSDLVGAFSLI